MTMRTQVPFDESVFYKEDYESPSKEILDELHFLYQEHIYLISEQMYKFAKEVGLHGFTDACKMVEDRLMKEMEDYYNEEYAS